jgi:hypothetical protein
MKKFTGGGSEDDDDDGTGEDFVVDFMGLSDAGQNYERADVATKRVEYSGQTGDIVMAKNNPPIPNVADYIGRLSIDNQHIPRRLFLSPYTGLYHGETVQEATKRVLEAEKMTVAQLAKNETKPLSKHVLTWMRVELDESKFNLKKLL